MGAVLICLVINKHSLKWKTNDFIYFLIFLEDKHSWKSLKHISPHFSHCVLKFTANELMKKASYFLIYFAKNWYVWCFDNCSDLIWEKNLMIKKGLEVWDALEQFIGTIEMPIETSNWDLETYRIKLEIIFSKKIMNLQIYSAGIINTM